MTRRRRIYPPSLSLKEFRVQCARYWRKERRDAVYAIVRAHIRRNCGSTEDIADGLSVMLLTWNQAAYRYGSFENRNLVRFLDEQTDVLGSFRRRKIRSFSKEDDGKGVRCLFDAMLAALYVRENSRRSPVGAAKALHMLAPDFFPLWDVEIAKRTGVYWYDQKFASDRYVEFMQDAQNTVIALEHKYRSGVRGGLPNAKSLATALSQRCGRKKTLLKFLDECYYAKYKLS